jgi:hypothetical protein
LYLAPCDAHEPRPRPQALPLAAMFAAISPGAVAIVALICGVFCGLLAQRNMQLKGVYPWKMHPAIWGVIGFLIGLIGVILCVIARATTKPPAVFPGYGSYPSTRDMPSGQWQPPPQGGYPGSYPAPGAHPDPGAIPAATAPPSWQPDPLTRHELRYWDGTQWTEHVSDRGTQSRDPL